jgi:serine protease AprX
MYGSKTTSNPVLLRSSENVTVSATTPTGTYPITVRGAVGSIVQKTTVTLTVTVSNFTISASLSSLSIQRGHQGASTITTAIMGGFNSAITLSASGLPSHTTVIFGRNPPAPGNCSSIMTITVGSGAPTGTYPVTVKGSDGGIHRPPRSN